MFFTSMEADAALERLEAKQKEGAIVVLLEVGIYFVNSPDPPHVL